MSAKPKLLDQFNPLTPGITGAKLLEMFIDAAQIGVMETFALMPVEKQKELLNKKDPRKNNGGRTALIVSAMGGKDEAVAHLLSLKPDLEATDNQGWTALAGAAWQGHEGVIEQLLDAGARIDARDGDNWTALHDALNGGHANSALLLLSRGADPTLKNSDDMNALDIARDLKLHAVIPALEAEVKKRVSRAGLKVMGHTTRDIEAPEKAQFSRKLSPGR